jgi:hypothetical protein
MSSLRSPILTKSLALNSVALDAEALLTKRAELVRTFNLLRGDPAGDVVAIQHDFIEGTMPYQDMVSYVRYCEYMIATATAVAAS